MRLIRNLGRACGTSVIAMFALAAAAQAATPALTTSCTAPPVSQPFLAWGDTAWYSAVPGESYDDFPATGWALSGGATVLSTTLADGGIGHVLVLPAGAAAVSPQVCVNNSYPYLRTLMRSSTYGSVKVAIAYLGSAGWGSATATGGFTGQPAWKLSSKIALVVGSSTAWQIARFTLTGLGSGTSTQVYNFYLDPRMGR